jgi:hypothetical protein
LIYLLTRLIVRESQYTILSGTQQAASVNFCIAGNVRAECTFFSGRIQNRNPGIYRVSRSAFCLGFLKTDQYGQDVQKHPFPEWIQPVRDHGLSGSHYTANRLFAAELFGAGQYFPLVSRLVVLQSIITAIISKDFETSGIRRLPSFNDPAYFNQTFFMIKAQWILVSL